MVLDLSELESEVRSLLSGIVIVLVLWETRGFEENHDFSLRVDRRTFAIEELEFEIRFGIKGPKNIDFKDKFF